MINSSTQIAPSTVEITTPIKNLNLHFIEVKGWSGQVLKMDVDLFKSLLNNYMSIQLSHELRRDKKLIKKLTDINIQTGKVTNFGTLLLMLEGIRGGFIYIDQIPSISKKMVSDFDFSQQGWNKLSDVFIVSMKNERFTLSLRTLIEARLLKDVIENDKFKLLNDRADSDNIIKVAEYKFKSPETRDFMENLYIILNCLGIKIKKDE